VDGFFCAFRLAFVNRSLKSLLAAALNWAWSSCLAHLDTAMAWFFHFDEMMGWVVSSSDHQVVEIGYAEVTDLTPLPA